MAKKKDNQPDQPAYAAAASDERPPKLLRLPAEVQNYTSYAGASMAARPNAEIARAFVRHLGSPDGQAVFAAAGIQR